MKITDIIMILLFIIPGVLCNKVSAWVGMPRKSKQSEFKEIVSSIFCSIPVVFISSYFYILIFKIKRLSAFEHSLNTINNLIIFGLIVIGYAFIFGIVEGVIRKPFLKSINWIREKGFKKVPLDIGGTCWETIFDERLEPQYIEIIKNGSVIAKGFVKDFSLPDDEKEIVFDNAPEEDWKEYPELETKLNKVINTYVDLEKGIIIKNYDITEYKAYCDALHNEKSPNPFSAGAGHHL